MRRMVIRALLALVFLSIPIDSAWGQRSFGEHTQHVAFNSGVLVGFNGGTGVQFFGGVANIADGFPFDVRLGVGYTVTQPGDARAARRIFINNATNGVPEERGWIWDFRLDVRHPTKLLGLPNATVFGGPRYVRFTGNFEFVGGNEDFDVQARRLGAGLGLESSFIINRKLDLLISSGFDYFPKGTLHGHDTWYNPDGDDINPREDYNYTDADNAINQPKYELRMMIGLQFLY